MSYNNNRKADSKARRKGGKATVNRHKKSSKLTHTKAQLAAALITLLTALINLIARLIEWISN